MNNKRRIEKINEKFLELEESFFKRKNEKRRFDGRESFPSFGCEGLTLIVKEKHNRNSRKMLQGRKEKWLLGLEGIQIRLI